MYIYIYICRERERERLAIYPPVCDKYTPFVAAFALLNCSRNCYPAPHSVFFKLNCPRLFFSGGVFFSQTPVWHCALWRDRSEARRMTCGMTQADRLRRLTVQIACCTVHGARTQRVNTCRRRERFKLAAQRCSCCALIWPTENVKLFDDESWPWGTAPSLLVQFKTCYSLRVPICACHPCAGATLIFSLRRSNL